MKISEKIPGGYRCVECNHVVKSYAGLRSHNWRHHRGHHERSGSALDGRGRPEPVAPAKQSFEDRMKKMIKDWLEIRTLIMTMESLERMNREGYMITPDGQVIRPNAPQEEKRKMRFIEGVPGQLRPVEMTDKEYTEYKISRSLRWIVQASKE